MALSQPTISAAEQASEEVDARPGSVTIRAISVGLAATCLVNLLPAYSAYIVHSSRMVFAHLPMAAMVAFTIIFWPLNAVVGSIRRKWALRRGEMIVVFCMAWIASSIPAANFMGLLIGGIAAPYYYATPENRWSELLLDHLPAWAVPPNKADEMTWFFEGKPVDAGIPWDAWVGPLLWWGLLLMALALVSGAIVSILRHQWVDRERLPFPLAEAPLTMTEEHEGLAGSPALARSRLFWVGLAIPLLIIIWNIAGYFSHLIPEIHVISGYDLPLGRGFPGIRIKLHFFVLGFAYFTNLDVLFSILFFYILGIVQTGIFERLGFTIGASDIWGSRGGAAIGWQAMGAFVTFTIVGLWMAREHIVRVYRKAIHDDPSINDSNEFMSYRQAFGAGGLGALFMLFWLWRSGMTLDVAAVYLVGLVIMTIGVSRIVAESGLLYARMPITPQSFTFYTLGISKMESTAAASLGLSYAAFGLGNTFGATTLTHIAKLGAEMRLRTRALFGAIVIALLLSLVISALFTLYLGYAHGAYNFNVYTFNAGNRAIYATVVQKMLKPFDTSLPRVGFFAIGAAVTGIISFLRYRYLWWPLSPIGMTTFPLGVLRNQVFSIFLVWLTKMILLKIGGIALYRRTMPLFMGMLLGYVIGIGLIFLVDVLFFLGEGHLVHHW
ncbi:hypothetical protein MK139_13585 [bacterium]|jgi:hypothetical protein|nr:hypothetical protein [bacterium]HCK09887.1 hypothetical protein [Candidatus Latescibacterota bacterium]